MGKPAARITDNHVCPMVTGVVPHVGGPIVLGSFTVFTGKLPQARVTDMLVCVGPPDTIAMGSTGVFVNSMPAARMGDITAHGGNIVLGLPTVLIGETGGGGGGGGAGPAGAGSSDNAYTGGAPTASIDSLRPTGAIPQVQPQVALAYANFNAQVQVLSAAAQNGTPFCEVCFQKALAELKQEVAIAGAPASAAPQSAARRETEPTPKGIAIYRVTHELDGSPVANALFEIQFPGGDIRRLRTDNDGVIRIPGDEGEEFTMIAISDHSHTGTLKDGAGSQADGTDA